MDNGEIKVSVKFSGRSIPVTLPIESTINDLKSILQPLTNVLPRGQKLIFKGFLFLHLLEMLKTLISYLIEALLMLTSFLNSIVYVNKGKVLENERTLKQSEVTNGAKIMLMASQGLHQGVISIIFVFPLFVFLFYQFQLFCLLYLCSNANLSRMHSS